MLVTTLVKPVIIIINHLVTAVDMEPNSESLLPLVIELVDVLMAILKKDKYVYPVKPPV